LRSLFPPLGYISIPKIDKVTIKYIARKLVKNEGLKHPFYEIVDFFSAVSQFAASAIALFGLSLKTFGWWVQIE
jgi:hypothetical protein